MIFYDLEFESWDWFNVSCWLWLFEMGYDLVRFVFVNILIMVKYGNRIILKYNLFFDY